MEHGQQREELGFDVNRVVREYGALRALIHEAAEREQLPWASADVRVLGDMFAIAIAEGCLGAWSASEARRRSAADDATRGSICGSSRA